MTTLAFSGDSIIQRRLLSFTDPEVKPLFDLVRWADAAFTNLEVLPNDYQGDPALESGGSHFGAPSWVLDDLVEAGFDLFATPTNHSLDYSISGLKYALAELDRRRLCHAGCGLNLEDARRAAYLTTPAATIGFVACASTFAKGQEASKQRPDMQGRPGLSPLRPDSIFEVRPEQLEQIREIAFDLGIEQQRRYLIDLGFAFEAEEGILPFNGMNFQAGSQPGHHRKPNSKDLDDILRWVDEARRMSDLVVVSLHAHEQGKTKEEPADFIIEFAHAVIDGGADVVVGHGPHLLRGMEIYRGKPIFYSLGNFIGQNEMVQRLPADSYDRFRADPGLPPGAVYQRRTNDDRLGFPADARYWETIVPICEFAGRDLVSLKVHPVSLGLGEPRHRRGRPRLAQGCLATKILDRFSTLSSPFGTLIRATGTIGELTLPVRPAREGSGSQALPVGG